MRKIILLRCDTKVWRCSGPGACDLGDIELGDIEYRSTPLLRVAPFLLGACAALHKFRNT